MLGFDVRIALDGFERVNLFAGWSATGYSRRCMLRRDVCIASESVHVVFRFARWSTARMRKTSAYLRRYMLQRDVCIALEGFDWVHLFARWSATRMRKTAAYSRRCMLGRGVCIASKGVHCTG